MLLFYFPYSSALFPLFPNAWNHLYTLYTVNKDSFILCRVDGLRWDDGWRIDMGEPGGYGGTSHYPYCGIIRQCHFWDFCGIRSVLLDVSHMSLWFRCRVGICNVHYTGNSA